MEFYLLNVVRITRLVAPIMQAQRSGAIVNISTYATFEPEALFPTSGVFRAGLAAFTKVFSDEYAAHNVRMNNVLPGFIDSLPEKEERRSRIPMGRYGTAQEVADLIAFLASDASSYITGRTSASTAASPVRSNPGGCPRASTRRGAGTAHPLDGAHPSGGIEAQARPSLP